MKLGKYCIFLQFGLRILFSVVTPIGFNGTALFKKCVELFEYQHFFLLETSGGQSFHLYLNVVHFFNASVN
jgi:hypothetical protein